MVAMNHEDRNGHIIVFIFIVHYGKPGGCVIVIAGIYGY